MKESKLNQLLGSLDKIILRLLEFHNEIIMGKLQEPNCNRQLSIDNLIYYRQFREYDIRDIQKYLGYLGITSLSNSEGHIMSSLMEVRNNVCLRTLNPNCYKMKARLSIKKSEQILNKHTKNLLGYRSKRRRVRIMVTIPTEAAYNYELVREMVKNGMNCARINCAHDGPEQWNMMINNIRRASKKIGKNVKITMDIAGPKIRTGNISSVPAVLKLPTKQNEIDSIKGSSTFVISAQEYDQKCKRNIQVDEQWVKKIKYDDKLFLRDVRNKIRLLKVEEINGNSIRVSCQKSCHIKNGIVVECTRPDIGNTKIRGITPIPKPIILKKGDVLDLTKSDCLGENKKMDENGKILENAHIPCQYKRVFGELNLGEKVLFDDGKIEGEIINSSEEHYSIQITKANINGSKLKQGKGINFPDSDLRQAVLSPKDKSDLEFVAQNADVVNFSFVNDSNDVHILLKELDRFCEKRPLGVIIKIETKQAYKNLFEILLASMRAKNVGVMIARGDLAVEVGWENIPKVQEEILALCGAAHIPVVWATQVLENLVKKGIPSRSELTDVASGLKAECIMLNKGPFINEALLLLNDMLSSLEQSHHKNNRMLPVLNNHLN